MRVIVDTTGGGGGAQAYALCETLPSQAMVDVLMGHSTSGGDTAATADDEDEDMVGG